MKKLILILFLFIAGMVAKSQTGVYFSEKIRYYPTYLSNAYKDTVVHTMVTLQPDSVMIVHNIDADSSLVLKMVTKLGDEIDSSKVYRTLVFLMKQSEDYYVLSLTYRRQDIALMVVGLTDGVNRVLIYIKSKDIEELIDGIARQRKYPYIRDWTRTVLTGE